ncbi:uncharacterized protein BROUX77_005808 [Berkeleyomyces rouxiae]|uniref:uncharacterized protein n=1 Tax=Berkeleyomyces rouxiae TaxID=2035830 RepID=UPI003B7686C9
MTEPSSTASAQAQPSRPEAPPKNNMADTLANWHAKKIQEATALAEIAGEIAAKMDEGATKAFKDASIKNGAEKRKKLEKALADTLKWWCESGGGVDTATASPAPLHSTTNNARGNSTAPAAKETPSKSGKDTPANNGTTKASPSEGRDKATGPTSGPKTNNSTWSQVAKKGAKEPAPQPEPKTKKRTSAEKKVFVELPEGSQFRELSPSAITRRLNEGVPKGKGVLEAGFSKKGLILVAEGKAKDLMDRAEHIKKALGAVTVEEPCTWQFVRVYRVERTIRELGSDGKIAARAVTEEDIRTAAMEAFGCAPLALSWWIQEGMHEGTVSIALDPKKMKGRPNHVAFMGTTRPVSYPSRRPRARGHSQETTAEEPTGRNTGDEASRKRRRVVSPHGIRDNGDHEMDVTEPPANNDDATKIASAKDAEKPGPPQAKNKDDVATSPADAMETREEEL